MWRNPNGRLFLNSSKLLLFCRAFLTLSGSQGCPSAASALWLRSSPPRAPVSLLSSEEPAFRSPPGGSLSLSPDSSAFGLAGMAVTGWHSGFSSLSKSGDWSIPFEPPEVPPQKAVGEGPLQPQQPRQRNFICHVSLQQGVSRSLTHTSSNAVQCNLTESVSKCLHWHVGLNQNFT